MSRGSGPRIPQEHPASKHVGWRVVHRQLLGRKAAVDDRSVQHARCSFCQIHHDCPISTAMRWLAARIHASAGAVFVGSRLGS